MIDFVIVKVYSEEQVLASPKESSCYYDHLLRTPQLQLGGLAHKKTKHSPPCHCMGKPHLTRANIIGTHDRGGWGDNRRTVDYAIDHDIDQKTDFIYKRSRNRKSILQSIMESIFVANGVP